MAALFSFASQKCGFHRVLFVVDESSSWNVFRVRLWLLLFLFSMNRVFYEIWNISFPPFFACFFFDVINKISIVFGYSFLFNGIDSVFIGSSFFSSTIFFCNESNVSRGLEPFFGRRKRRGSSSLIHSSHFQLRQFKKWNFEGNKKNERHY